MKAKLKVLLIILLLAVVVSSLTACFEEKSSNNNNNKGGSTEFGLSFDYQKPNDFFNIKVDNLNRHFSGEQKIYGISFKIKFNGANFNTLNPLVPSSDFLTQTDWDAQKGMLSVVIISKDGYTPITESALTAGMIVRIRFTRIQGVAVNTLSLEALTLSDGVKDITRQGAVSFNLN
ncbi:MAG: hypothetical protein FWD49_00565 [Firmicutes bacterium]|nr:hypothetical protein [Bacillota bacterium]